MVTHSERHVGAGKINEQQLIGYSEQAYLSINSLLITQGSNRIKMLVEPGLSACLCKIVRLSLL